LSTSNWEGVFVWTALLINWVKPQLRKNLLLKTYLTFLFEVFLWGEEEEASWEGCIILNAKKYWWKLTEIWILDLFFDLRKSDKKQDFLISSEKPQKIYMFHTLLKKFKEENFFQIFFWLLVENLAKKFFFYATAFSQNGHFDKNRGLFRYFRGFQKFGEKNFSVIFRQIPRTRKFWKIFSEIKKSTVCPFFQNFSLLTKKSSWERNKFYVFWRVYFKYNIFSSICFDLWKFLDEIVLRMKLSKVFCLWAYLSFSPRGLPKKRSFVEKSKSRMVGRNYIGMNLLSIKYPLLSFST